jgi:hypothetical protein
MHRASLPLHKLSDKMYTVKYTVLLRILARPVLLIHGQNTVPGVEL